MDNDDATIGKIFSRREALRATAMAGFGLAMTGVWSRVSRAASAVPTTQPRLPLVASPTLTEGPFFVDEKLIRSNGGRRGPGGHGDFGDPPPGGFGAPPSGNFSPPAWDR